MGKCVECQPGGDGVSVCTCIVYELVEMKQNTISQVNLREAVIIVHALNFQAKCITFCFEFVCLSHWVSGWFYAQCTYYTKCVECQLSFSGVLWSL